MTAIHKYQLKQSTKVVNQLSARVPKVHKLVHLAYDSEGDICVWLEVDPEAEVDSRIKFQVYQTGKIHKTTRNVLYERDDPIGKHFKTLVDNDAGNSWHFYLLP